MRKSFYFLFSISRHFYEEERYNRFRLKYDIDPSFKFNGDGIYFYGDGTIKCGENSYIGRYSSIQAYKNCKVVIGNNCLISHFVKIYTQNSIADQDFSKEIKDSTGDVTIGDYCWIGANVFIKEGIAIGENTVIGASSVVTKNLPPHSIVAGNPAKIIKFKSYLDKAEKEELVSRYWDTLSDKIKLESKYLEMTTNKS